MRYSIIRIIIKDEISSDFLLFFASFQSRSVISYLIFLRFLIKSFILIFFNMTVFTSLSDAINIDAFLTSTRSNIRRLVRFFRSIRRNLQSRHSDRIIINSIVQISTTFDEISIEQINFSFIFFIAFISISIILVMISINNSSLTSRKQRESESNYLQCVK